MKLKLIIFIFFIGLMTPVAHADGVQEIEKRNEAAGFAGTLKVFIGRAARDCKPYLNKDDEWMHGVVKNWMSRNSKYAEAAEAWISAYLTFIANEKGMETGQDAKQKILETIISNADAMSSDLIVGSKNQKVEACTDFEKKVVGGIYDITNESRLYNELEGLVKTVNL